MQERILITGGAGFIGSHLADELLAAGYQVRVLDILHPQVHGPGQNRPEYLDAEVEVQVGDIRNSSDIRRALDGIDSVFHFAASVGVGQSMYEIAAYTEVNNLGTALLLEELARRPVNRLLVASSMSLYGEGLYIAPDGSLHEGRERKLDQLKRREWELYSTHGELLRPLPTPESKQPTLASVYALSKFDQERLCLMVGNAYGMPTTALRFFNVFGTRQALSNPYTGVLAIFCSRLLNGNAPLIFEDGRQRRDFVHVKDVARACRLALESPHAEGQVFNIGSGLDRTIREVAERLAAVMGRPDIAPEITGKYRVGDIRHCFADIGLAREILGYQPQVDFEQGLVELAGWLEGRVSADRAEQASAELAMRGLTV